MTKNKKYCYLIFLFAVLGSSGFSQTFVAGKIVDERLLPLEGIRIFQSDTTVLATTDANGNFKLQLPNNTSSLLIRGIGLEPKLINFDDSCTYFDVVMLYSASYDFVSLRRIDKIRKKQFDKLPQLYQLAYAKGIFSKRNPCYIDHFISSRKRKPG